MILTLPVDHVVVLVADLEAAGQAFETAGFHVTPKALHSNAMGTANRCVMLEGSYIELMGIVAETDANATWRKLFAEGGGIRGIALGSTDLRVSAEAIAASGIVAEPVRHFSRATAAGDLRFSVVRIAPSATPGLQCLVCQHQTEALLWLPETLAHANGATRLMSISLPQAASLTGLPKGGSSNGIPVESGSDRLVLSGSRAKSFDLRAVCGVELEIVAL